jgi:hypothetical protein
MIKFGRVCLRGRRCALTNNLSAAAAAAVVVCDQQATSIVVSRFDSHGFYCYDTTFRSTQSSKFVSSTRRSDLDVRQCNTTEDLVHLAYDHLDTISLRGIAAFWAALPKLLHRRDGKSRDQLNEQLCQNIVQYTGKYEEIQL